MAYLLLPLSLAAWFTVYLLWNQIRTALQARHWPRHPARVLASHLTRQYSRAGFVYTVRVRVEYSIGGPRTVHAKLPSQFGTTREGYALRLFRFFHVGATVPVSVNPGRPDVGVLLPGVEHRDWIIFGLMLVTAAGATVATFFV